MPGLIFNTQTGRFASPMVDVANPVNWQHPLNIGRIAWYKCIANPGWRGGSVLHDLVRGPGHTPNDGVLTGTPKPTWHGSQGLVGSDGSLTFNGSNTVVTGNNKVADNLPAMTVSCWIKNAVNPNAPIFISKIDNTSTGAGWALEDHSLTATTVPEFFIQAAGGNQYYDFYTTATFTNNKWYHVVAMYTGAVNGIVIYVNGIKQSLINNGSTGTVTSYSTTDSIIIGNTTSSSVGAGYGPFIGSIDDVSIWNRALSAQEIADIYNLSRQGYPGVLNYLNPIEYSFPTLSDNSVASATGSSTASATSNVVNAVSSITYNGVALTFIGAQNAVGSVGRVESWGLVNPPQGTNPIVVNMLGSATTTIGTAASYTGVNQTQPTESWSGNYAVNTTSSAATVVVTPATTGDWLHAAIATNATSVTAGQTARNNVGGASGSGSNEDTGPVSPAPTPMTYII